MANTEKQVQLSTITPVAGERKTATLISGVRTHSVILTFEAGIDVTANADSSRNRGSILALFDNIGVNVDGEDRIMMDARAARMWNEINAISPLPYRRFTDIVAASAAGKLRETVRIDLANPRVAYPEETALTERNIKQSMDAFVTYNGLATKLFGGGTVVITNPTVRVQQVYDTSRQELPLFRPSVRMMTAAVPSANDRFEIILKPGRYVGGLLIQQDSDAGEVDDLINSISLRGDDGRDIIPQQLPWKDAVEASSFNSGGNIGESYAYLGLNFLRLGRLSKLIHPYAMNNLRLTLDVKPSDVAGATNGRIRVLMFEYERDSELTAAALPDFTL